MGFYNNAGGIAHPTTKYELAEEISIRLDRGQTNLNDIDTSKITDMSSLFYHVFQRRAIKNIDVSLWDTSNVTTMSYMFFGCSIFNCDISNWNVSKVNNKDISVILLVSISFILVCPLSNLIFISFISSSFVVGQTIPPAFL